jgi:hypothetical protein
MQRTTALCLIMILSAGCFSKNTLPGYIAPFPEFSLPKAHPIHKLTEEDILAIARRAVAERETWIDQAHFERPQRELDDSGWYVIVWRLPKTPGGLRRICIDDRGNVTCYRHGH